MPFAFSSIWDREKWTWVLLAAECCGFCKKRKKKDEEEDDDIIKQASAKALAPF